MKYSRYFQVLMVVCFIFIMGCSDNDGSGPDGTESDTTPPAILSTSPADDAVNVSRSSPCWVLFSEEMNKESVLNNMGMIPFPGIYPSWRGDTLYLTPTSLLSAGTLYTITAGAQCEDKAGNEMGSDYSFSFTTNSDIDNLPPEVLSTYPLDGATGVNPGANIEINFSETIALLGDWSSQTAIEIDPYPSDGYFIYDGNTIVIMHWPFGADELVTVTVTTEVTDLTGNPMVSSYEFSFTTLTDNTRPYLASASPSNGQANVSRNLNSIILNFSEPMFPASFDNMQAENVDAKINAITQQEPEWNEDLSTIEVTLSEDLFPGCLYWVFFENITDMAGNPIDPNPTYYRFTTSGTASYYPVGSGYNWYFLRATDSPEYLGYIPEGFDSRRQTENYNSSSGTFEEVWYDDEGEIEDKSFLRLTSSQVQHLGIAMYDNGSLQAVLMWDDVLPMFKLPLADHLGETWSFSTGCTYQDTVDVTVDGYCNMEPYTRDVINGFFDGTFADCYVHHLDVTMAIYVHEELVESTNFHQTSFLTSGLGLVQVINQDGGEPSPPDTLFLNGWEF